MNKTDCRKLMKRIYAETNAEHCAVISYEGNPVVEARYPDITKTYGSIEDYEASRAAAGLGRRGGLATSPRKAAAVRKNGRLGGRPPMPASRKLKCPACGRIRTMPGGRVRGSGRAYWECPACLRLITESEIAGN